MIPSMQLTLSCQRTCLLYVPFQFQKPGFVTACILQNQPPAELRDPLQLKTYTTIEDILTVSSKM